MNDRTAILCNPSSENTKALRVTAEVETLLRGAGRASVSFTGEWPESLEPFAQVWIVGGDGTLNHFINRYPDAKQPLAAIPGGSANDFHWTLYGGDFTLQQLAERLLADKTRAIDAGLCNGRYFLNGAGIGFDGAIVRDLIGKKKLAGKASYLLSVLKHIVTYRETALRLEGGGLSHEGDCMLLSVANGGRYGGEFHVAPGALPDDGLFDVNFVGRIPPLKRMRYLPVMERGQHLDLPFVWHGRSKELVIECAQELPAHLDGEYLSAKRFEITCLPKKFLFVC